MQKIAEAHSVGVRGGCGESIASRCINHLYKSHKEQKEMCGDFQFKNNIKKGNKLPTQLCFHDAK
jgi:hypothetical protein